MSWTEYLNEFGRISPLAQTALNSIRNDAMIEEGSLSTAMLGSNVQGILRVSAPNDTGAAVIINGGTGTIEVYDGLNTRVVVGNFI